MVVYQGMEGWYTSHYEGPSKQRTDDDKTSSIKAHVSP